jgi:hypothetical protein
MPEIESADQATGIAVAFLKQYHNLPLRRDSRSYDPLRNIVPETWSSARRKGSDRARLNYLR